MKLEFRRRGRIPKDWYILGTCRWFVGFDRVERFCIWGWRDLHWGWNCLQKELDGNRHGSICGRIGKRDEIEMKLKMKGKEKEGKVT
jgi:hypothetical protein